MERSNWPRLEQRFLELLQPVCAALPELLEPPLPEVAAKLAATRNYLAHGASELEAQALEQPDWFAAEQLLRLLVRSHLLMTAGFPDSMVSNVWQRSPTYDWTRSLVREVNWLPESSV